MLIFPNPDRDKFKNIQFKFDRDSQFVDNLSFYRIAEAKPDMIVEHTCENTSLTSEWAPLNFIPIKTAETKELGETEDYFHVHN